MTDRICQYCHQSRVKPFEIEPGRFVYLCKCQIKDSEEKAYKRWKWSKGRIELLRDVRRVIVEYKNALSQGPKDSTEEEVKLHLSWVADINAELNDSLLKSRGNNKIGDKSFY